MKKWIWMVAGSVITALVFLAFNPEVIVDTGRRMFASTNDFDAEAWFEEARTGVDAGNPYWEVAMGQFLMTGNHRTVRGDGFQVPPDPARGRALLESAAAKGHPQALTLLWMVSGRQDDRLLQRAVDAGDPGAISLTVVRLLERAECTTDGRAAFEAALPSPEALQSAHPDLVLARLATFPDPSNWADAFEKRFRRSYEVVLTDLSRDLIGLHCAAKGTPIPVGA